MFMPHWPNGLGRRVIQLGLEPVKHALTLLGNPERHLPPVVHIAGTNGKGSSLAYIKAIMEKAGYRVHRYSSPHLFHFNERIHLAGEDISDAALFSLLEECRLKLKDVQLSFFEATTAAAFLAFSRKEADILLLETGMGGRLDATNIVPNPRLTIITSVSFDHMEYLGASLAEIAYEKAGILKKNTPCVVSYQDPDALRAIEKQAMAMESFLYRFGQEWGIQKEDDASMQFVSAGKVTKYPLPGLIGDHQICNAGHAIQAVKMLEEYPVTDAHIKEGLHSVVWPGRLHPVTTGRLVSLLPNSDFELWFDGGHNEAGGYVLVDWIESHAHRGDKRPTYVIIGMTEGKQRINFVKPFIGKVPFMCSVNIQTEPCAKPTQQLANEIQALGIKVWAADTLEEAVPCVVKQAAAPGRILICGSLYLANDVRHAS